jgi:hypothetical protein
VTAAANLVAYRSADERQLAELDGVIVELRQDGQVTTTLLEVKRQRVGARADAETQLKRSVRRLRPRSGVAVSAIASALEGRIGRAWVTLALPPATT